MHVCASPAICLHVLTGKLYMYHLKLAIFSTGTSHTLAWYAALATAELRGYNTVTACGNHKRIHKIIGN